MHATSIGVQHVYMQPSRVKLLAPTMDALAPYLRKLCPPLPFAPTKYIILKYGTISVTNMEYPNIRGGRKGDAPTSGRGITSIMNGLRCVEAIYLPTYLLTKSYTSTPRTCFPVGVPSLRPLPSVPPPLLVNMAGVILSVTTGQNLRDRPTLPNLKVFIRLPVLMPYRRRSTSTG